MWKCKSDEKCERIVGPRYEIALTKTSGKYILYLKKIFTLEPKQR